MHIKEEKGGRNMEAFKEKKCKHCAMMIPKYAKICPHCKKKQGWGLGIKIFLGVIAIAVLIALVGKERERSKMSTPATEAVREVALTEKGKVIKQKHSGWSNEFCNVISERKITLDMTKEQVLLAWGKPDHINTETRASLEQELWWYGNLAKGTILHFINGKLAYINENK
jgi:hypothetical protein